MKYRSNNMDLEYCNSLPSMDSEEQQQEQEQNNNNEMKMNKKKMKGLNAGSGKLQPIASAGLGSLEKSAATGGGFIPHFITVKTGKNMVKEVVTYFNNKHSVCILSATGSASKVIFNNPDDQSSESTLRYEGLFEIISLSGSYLFDGSFSRSKRLKVSAAFADSNGEIFGGAVKSLIAGRPIHLVVVTFKHNSSANIMKRNSAGSSSVAAVVANMSNDFSDLKLISDESGYDSPTTSTASNNTNPQNQNINSE